MHSLCSLPEKTSKTAGPRYFRNHQIPFYSLSNNRRQDPHPHVFVDLLAIGLLKNFLGIVFDSLCVLGLLVVYFFKKMRDPTDNGNSGAGNAKMNSDGTRSNNDNAVSEIQSSFGVYVKALMNSCAKNLSSFVEDENYEFTLNPGELVHDLCGSSSSSSNPSESPTDSENDSAVTVVDKGSAPPEPSSNLLLNTTYDPTTISGRENMPQIPIELAGRLGNFESEIINVGRIGRVGTLESRELSQASRAVVVRKHCSSPTVVTSSHEIMDTRRMQLYQIYSNFARNEALKFARTYGLPSLPDPNSPAWKNFVLMMMSQQNAQPKVAVPRPLTSMPPRFMQPTSSTTSRSNNKSNYYRIDYGNEQQYTSRIVDVTSEPGRIELELMKAQQQHGQLRTMDTFPINYSADRRIGNGCANGGLFHRAPPGLPPPFNESNPHAAAALVHKEADCYDKQLDNMLLMEVVPQLKSLRQPISKFKSLVGKKIVGKPDWTVLQSFF